MRIVKSGFGLDNFWVDLDAFTNKFPGRHKLHFPVQAARMNSATGKVKTTLHGTAWYSGTATQQCTFHGVACMATINYNYIHDS